MPCRRFNRHICLTVELSKQTLAGCRGCITTCYQTTKLYLCIHVQELYPGLYRALYAFEPERTCIAKMESDKVQTWGWGPLLCSMAYTSPHLGSDQVPLSGCRYLSLCILIYMRTANPDKGLASKSGILGGWFWPSLEPTSIYIISLSNFWENFYNTSHSFTI